MPRRSRLPLAASLLLGFKGFKKIVSLNSFPDQGEASNKISAQSVQLFGLKRVIVTLAVYPLAFSGFVAIGVKGFKKIVSLKPSPDL